MAKAKVVHSSDGVEIIFRGDKSNPEPSIGVITFPGGHVEVSRCSDGSYYAHLAVVDSANIVASRFDFQDSVQNGIPAVTAIPNGNLIKHMAIRVENIVPRPDFD